jgi:hypothetical protein
MRASCADGRGLHLVVLDGYAVGWISPVGTKTGAKGRRGIRPRPLAPYKCYASEGGQKIREP